MSYKGGLFSVVQSAKFSHKSLWQSGKDCSQTRLGVLPFRVSLHFNSFLLFLCDPYTSCVFANREDRFLLISR